MDEENRQPRPGVSRSFIFSIFIVAAIIALVAYFIFSNSNPATTLDDKYAFMNYLYNGRVTEVQVVSGENFTTVRGKYFTDDARKTKANYTITFDGGVLDTPHYWVDTNGDNLVNDLDKQLTLRDIIGHAYETYKDDPVVKFKENNTANPYSVSWWDQWGPTIILIGGTRTDRWTSS